MSRMRPAKRPVARDKRTTTPDEREEIRQILVRNGRGPNDLTVVDGAPAAGTGVMHVEVWRADQYVTTIIVVGWNDDWLLHFEEKLKAGAYD